MVATGLMEAVVALGLHALLLASLLTGATVCTLLAQEGWRVQAELFRERQIEHLLDVAAAAAGAGPGRPAAVASADAATVVLAADSDGDGTVDATSAERTELELRAGADDDGVRLLHRIGRQAMTIDTGLPAAAELRVWGADGAPATVAAAATAVEVPLKTGARRVLLPAALP